MQGLSTPLQKAGASTVNCLVVLAASLPLLTQGFDLWRVGAVIMFFVYNVIFRERCLGMMVVGSHQNAPTSLLHISLYTFGFCSLLWSISFPGDLAMLNGAVHLVCVKQTGLTWYSYLSGHCTLRGISHG